MFLEGFFDVINQMSVGKGWSVIFNFERGAIGFVLGIIRSIGIVLALIGITIIAIQYLKQGNRPVEMGRMKERFLPFIIGVIIFLAGTELIEVIIDLVVYAWG